MHKAPQTRGFFVTSTVPKKRTRNRDMCYNTQKGDIMRKNILLLGIILLPSVLLAQSNPADKVQYIQAGNDKYYVKDVAVPKVSQAVDADSSDAVDVGGGAKGTKVNKPKTTAVLPAQRVPTEIVPANNPKEVQLKGGACIVRDRAVSDKLELIKKFGHVGDEHFCLGINAKQSEFHAAMGLSVFPHLHEIIEKRKIISELYDSYLAARLQRPARQEGLVYNYAYYPVLFETEKQLLEVFNALHQQDIYPRRYFYPSLNTLPYVEKQPCPIAEDIVSRVACLPLYADLTLEEAEKISRIIKENL